MAESDQDSTRRFSGRVEDYVRYRPHYPDTVVDFFRESLGLRPEHVVADIGSGTGFLSELFLSNGNRVYGVEPNAEMRAAGEHYLAGFPHFTSVAGTAETTTLPETSADFVVAGQAFHWFEPAATKREFQRILRPVGWVALVWNDRKIDTTPFLRAYEVLLEQFCQDQSAVARRAKVANDSASLSRFFSPHPFSRHVTSAHFQEFNFAGLRGRLLSSSYAPLPGSLNYEPMMAGLRGLFEQHQELGLVRFEYSTEICYGRLGAVAS